MKENKEKKINAGLIVGGVALTAVGIVVVPPLMKKYGNKIFKNSSTTDDIDFDNLGPEIVKKEKDIEEKKETNEEEQ